MNYSAVNGICMDEVGLVEGLQNMPGAGIAS